MSEPSATPQIADSLVDLIGDTPLLRLNRVTEGLTCTVAVKLEMLNPGGSVKDRPALAMIEQAERAGVLKPGGTIVEPTSGNTGVGLAIVAAQRGYDCIFVVTDKVAPEKIHLLEAYGARVDRVPRGRRARGSAVLLLGGRAAGGRDARSLPAQPVRQRVEPVGARADDRPRDLAADRRPHHALRGRRGHRRHDHRRRPLPQGPEPGRADRRRRPGGVGVLGRVGSARTWWRASARTSGPPPTTPRSSTGWCRSPTRTASSWPGG